MRILLRLMALALLCGQVCAETASPPAPKSMAYVLQASGLAADRPAVVRRLAECGRDWVVLDAVYSTDDGPWTPEEIQAIRAGKPGRRVLAYVSIGEAEDYRPYWCRAWDADGDGKPDAAAPGFLHTENPDWKGNYRVRYWHREWQELMLPAVDQVVAQGFDGIYLDIVDAFEFYEYDPVSKDWRDNLVNPETGNSYRRDMIAWVAAIAARARARRPEFGVIPQNAAQLLEHAEYRDMITAIGVEDLFVNGSKLRAEKEYRYVTGFLNRLKDAGKPVLVIDYPATPQIHAAAFEVSARQGFIHLLTDRDLKTLGVSSGGAAPE
jgi:cysteinyl-tRNA synthetase, unknown class